KRRSRESLTPVSEYRAVDLHVRSRRSLAPLLKAWPDSQTPGRIGTDAPRWMVLNWPPGARTVPKTAEAAVRAFLEAVSRLPVAARRCWTQASSRTFDIGIQAGLAPRSFEEVVLGPRTVEAIARVGGQVQITLYAPHDEND